MLDILSGLEALYLEFSGTPKETATLGAASGLVLTFKRLHTLSVRGFFTDFLEEAMSWQLPMLESLAVDFLGYRTDTPDILAFVEVHGARLTFLDIMSISSLDVASILYNCPQLTTFCFNPDWSLLPEPVFLGDGSQLVRYPHPNITTIGCHQLQYAFGVGFAATYASRDPLSAHLIRKANDFNFAALNKRNFPKLQRIRILNKMLLRDLEKADGPDPSCYERWERWWDQCAGQKIRLEDCTGAVLGTLPEKEVEETEDGSYVSSDAPVKDTFTVIRELMLECRRLTALPYQPGMQPAPAF
ncbi:hypothetical protein EIP91_007975 [Steccherinum ochraceum]|uniref:Uncharacterized protein n=1 Tax=Steccherinum ochraceum TaxID=92696 RepID=A0A4R0RBP6_9APHY|nr:hypothetical protein EIP91_007975 [Steccherinum ochraceum]